MGDEESKLPAKVYFRIGEVASLVGVEPHVLRYWEREFRTIRPKKSARGQRVYSRKDVETLMRVRQLLYSEGFTIAGARRRLQQERTGASDILPAEEVGLSFAAAATSATSAALPDAIGSVAAPAASDMIATAVMGGAPVTVGFDSAPSRERERERERERPGAATPALQRTDGSAAVAAAVAVAPHRTDGPGSDRAERRVMHSALRELRHEIESFLAELG